MSHYHVASGLAGYGPDGSDDSPTFESLGEALEYARDELAEFADMAHEGAHAFAEREQYQDAWREVERMEALELLRANLDPKRASAPLYVDDAAAYAALQESQAAEFPVDVSYNTRLYLWECAETECVQPMPEECDAYVNEPAYGSCVVSLDGRNIGQSADVAGAFRILAARMWGDGYFPNVWHVNERGNTTLVSLEETGTYTFTDTSYV